MTTSEAIYKLTHVKKGYDLNDEVEPILNEYGSAEDVPDKTN